MVVFLSGGTGTPKLLAGADDVFPPDETCVVANTGDDVEIGGNLVCPDLDTVLFLDGGVLDRERWWGIEGDSHRTHSRLQEVASVAGLDPGPRYLPDSEQTSGRRISRWRRFSGVSEFMTIGDRDRAVHITRTGLLDEGHSLTDATRRLADAYSLERELLPMSDDPVATLVHTDEDVVHFQEWWVHGRGEPPPRAVELRGIEDARPSLAVRQRLDGEEPVVVGPSNPVTSIGPILALPGVEDALYERPVVAVSPFVEDRVFSGPAADLMEMAGHDPSTSGVADTFPFVDAFVLDDADGTDLDRPVVRTDTGMASDADSERVAAACRRALEEVGA